MEKFTLVLGEENKILSGGLCSQYEVDVLDDKMVCTKKKDIKISTEIPYTTFKSAEFGIGNGNLWLQCELEEGKLVFCSPRKCWKSEVGKKLIENINKVVEIKDMKAYKQYTGPFFFFAMFK